MIIIFIFCMFQIINVSDHHVSDHQINFTNSQKTQVTTKVVFKIGFTY